MTLAADCQIATATLLLQDSLTLGVIANQQQTPDTSTQLPHASVEQQRILRSASPHDNREEHRRLNSNLKASRMFGFLITLREETLPVYHTHQGGKSETNTAQL